MSESSDRSEDERVKTYSDLPVRQRHFVREWLTTDDKLLARFEAAEEGSDPFTISGDEIADLRIAFKAKFDGSGALETMENLASVLIDKVLKVYTYCQAKGFHVVDPKKRKATKEERTFFLEKLGTPFAEARFREEKAQKDPFLFSCQRITRGIGKEEQDAAREEYASIFGKHRKEMLFDDIVRFRHMIRKAHEEACVGSLAHFKIALNVRTERQVFSAREKAEADKERDKRISAVARKKERESREEEEARVRQAEDERRQHLEYENNMQINLNIFRDFMTHMEDGKRAQSFQNFEALEGLASEVEKAQDFYLDAGIKPTQQHAELYKISGQCIAKLSAAGVTWAVQQDPRKTTRTDKIDKILHSMANIEDENEAKRKRVERAATTSREAGKKVLTESNPEDLPLSQNATRDELLPFENAKQAFARGQELLDEATRCFKQAEFLGRSRKDSCPTGSRVELLSFQKGGKIVRKQNMTLTGPKGRTIEVTQVNSAVAKCMEYFNRAFPAAAPCPAGQGG